MAFHLSIPGVPADIPAEDGPVGRFQQIGGVIDFLGDDEATDKTAKHYTEQWGPGVSFLKFIKSNPGALNFMPSGQMGWPALFQDIRKAAQDREVYVYDAACGYGGIFAQLFADPVPPGLRYLGADIHQSLATIERGNIGLDRARFIRWDISSPPPVAEKFNFVICRNALMHTPLPEKTLRGLRQLAKPDGRIAVSVYAKKPLLREIIDDALREKIVPLSVSDAFTLANQFTKLGRDLRATPGKITIKEDLPFFGIKAGEYDVQAFIYEHIIKCWYNDAFGEDKSDVVNFDWYHPPFAYRYSPDEIKDLFNVCRLDVTAFQSTHAQHYLEATLRHDTMKTYPVKLPS